jgi:hypothetical protein
MKRLICLSLLLPSLALADNIGEGGLNGIVEGGGSVGGSSSIALDDGVALDLGTTGVRLTGASGVLTILGRGAGFDENLTLNLDTTTNVGAFASGTGLARLHFTSMALSFDIAQALHFVEDVGANATPDICWGSDAAGTSCDTGFRVAASNILVVTAGGTNTMSIQSGSVGINTAAATVAGTLTSSGTGTLGWSVVAGANTACTTTCTNACVMGFAIDASGGSNPVACADATADNCLCAGAN